MEIGKDALVHIGVYTHKLFDRNEQIKALTMFLRNVKEYAR
jgi:hypothetical protein